MALIVLVLFSGLLLVALRFGIVGAHGGTFRREANPMGYWIGVGLIVLVLTAASAHILRLV